jgi:uracil-DNA glycosylase
MSFHKAKSEIMTHLSGEVFRCNKCPLFKSRKNPLVGEGSLDAEIMMIGEAPGYHEDLQGKAFIGKAGTILDQLLKHVHLLRQDLYITNILKCHPQQNHNPTFQEIKACESYLYRQIKIICPKIIITLGKFATQTLFSKVSLPFSKISEIHGKIFEIKASYGTVKILPHYHPSVACYNLSMLDTLKQDFEKTIGSYADH